MAFLVDYHRNRVLHITDDFSRLGSCEANYTASAASTDEGHEMWLKALTLLFVLLFSGRLVLVSVPNVT